MVGPDSLKTGENSPRTRSAFAEIIGSVSGELRRALMVAWRAGRPACPGPRPPLHQPGISRQRRPGVPIPKFARVCRTLDANFGIEGHQQLYDSSAALNPKFATRLAAIVMRTSGSRH